MILCRAPHKVITAAGLAAAGGSFFVATIAKWDGAVQGNLFEFLLDFVFHGHLLFSVVVSPRC